MPERLAKFGSLRPDVAVVYDQLGLSGTRTDSESLPLLARDPRQQLLETDAGLLLDYEQLGREVLSFFVHCVKRQARARGWVGAKKKPR